MKLSIIIPVLNEEESIPTLIAEVTNMITALEDRQIAIEVIVNNNASSDNSLKLLNDWAKVDSYVRVQDFPRTVSFQASIMRGFRAATGDAAVVLQSDLQDPPSLILQFVDEWLQGARVVVGIPANRHSTWPQYLARKSFYALFKSANKLENVTGFQDFYLLAKPIYKEIANRNENFQFIRGTIASEYGVDKAIPYDRRFRASGKPSFSFSTKYELAMDALLIRASRLNRIITICGLSLAVIAFTSLLALLITWLLGIPFAPRGWSSTVSLLLVLIGLSSAFSALILEYLSRLLYLALLSRDTQI